MRSPAEIVADLQRVRDQIAKLQNEELSLVLEHERLKACVIRNRLK